MNCKILSVKMSAMIICVVCAVAVIVTSLRNCRHTTQYSMCVVFVAAIVSQMK